MRIIICLFLTLLLYAGADQAGAQSSAGCDMPMLWRGVTLLPDNTPLSVHGSLSATTAKKIALPMGPVAQSRNVKKIKNLRK